MQPLLEGPRPQTSPAPSPDDCRGERSIASSHCHLHKASQSASSSLSPPHRHTLPARQRPPRSGTQLETNYTSRFYIGPDPIAQSHKSQRAVRGGIIHRGTIFYSEITFPSERSDDTQSECCQCSRVIVGVSGLSVMSGSLRLISAGQVLMVNGPFDSSPSSVPPPVERSDKQCCVGISLVCCLNHDCVRNSCDSVLHTPTLVNIYRGFFVAISQSAVVRPRLSSDGPEETRFSVLTRSEETAKPDTVYAVSPTVCHRKCRKRC